MKIRYFGMLAEITNCSEEQITFTAETVNDLLKELMEKHPKLAEMDFQVAQNNTIVLKTEKITSGDIALLPPFAGG